MIKRLLVAGIITAMLLFSGVYWLALDMGRLSEGEQIAEATSPQGTYTLKAYLVNPHATVSYAIRGELHFNSAKAKPQTIYWNYREETADILWLDENRVVINGIALSVPYGIYDFRR